MALKLTSITSTLTCVHILSLLTNVIKSTEKKIDLKVYRKRVDHLIITTSHFVCVFKFFNTTELL